MNTSATLTQGTLAARPHETLAAAQYEAPAVALSADLDRIDELLENPVPSNVEELLVTLDAAQNQMAILEASHVEMGDLRTRWDEIVHLVETRPQLISVPARNLQGGMHALRAAHPPATNLWWQADNLRRSALQKQLFRALLFLIIVAAIVYGAAWFFTYITPDNLDTEASSGLLLGVTALLITRVRRYL